MARSCTWVNATVPCSAVTKSSSRKPLPHS
jgi:hypothetical protein